MPTSRLDSDDLTRKHWTSKTATRVLRVWRESGMSLCGFARANGVSADRLRRWARRVEGCEERATVEAAPMRLVPVTVMGVVARPVMRLPGGVELEGDAGAFPAEWVATLARALVKP
jgi:hypothetical protein